jgi:hypothetical protein
MRLRGLLIAALVLVLAGTGAVAYVAANDDGPDSTAMVPGSRSEAPAETQTPPAAPGTEGAPEITESPEPPTETAPDNGAPDPAPAAPEPNLGDDTPAAGGKPEKTHFKREPKDKPQNDEPDRRKFAVPPAQQFSGDGNASLGTVDVKANSLLKWRARGRLEIRFGREAFPIVAPTKTGQLVLPPFLFTKVRVLAGGPWKITITPQ